MEQRQTRARWIGTFGLPLARTFATQGDALRWIAQEGLGSRQVTHGTPEDRHRHPHALEVIVEAITTHQR